MIQSWRLRTTLIAMGILMAVFTARLFYLQLLQGDFYSTLADDNRFDRVSIAAPRGVVYDSNRLPPGAESTCLQCKRDTGAPA